MSESDIKEIIAQEIISKLTLDHHLNYDGHCIYLKLDGLTISSISFHCEE